jgi:hypothetical protein
MIDKNVGSLQRRDADVIVFTGRRSPSSRICG